jgi:hypothetical protein
LTIVVAQAPKLAPGHVLLLALQHPDDRPGDDVFRLDPALGAIEGDGHQLRADGCHHLG